MTKILNFLKNHPEVQSILTTFIAGFALAVIPLINTPSKELLETGVIFGILMAGVRAGLKLSIVKLIELLEKLTV